MHGSFTTILHLQFCLFACVLQLCKRALGKMQLVIQTSCQPHWNICTVYTGERATFAAVWVKPRRQMCQSMTYWLLWRNYPYVSQLFSSWSVQSLPGRKQVCVTSATVANWSLCSKYLHVSQPFSKMIYAVCSTAADWLPLSLPENIQLWPSLSETASELWVNWTWWSRHHGNLTGTAVCIAEMDLLLLIGIIFIMVYFTQLLRKLYVYAFDSIQYCISVCSVQLILGSIGWNGKRGCDIMTTA